MKIELTKEQINILNELCFSEMIKMSQMLNNEFIDKKQVKTYMNKLQELLDILVIDK